MKKLIRVETVFGEFLYINPDHIVCLESCNDSEKHGHFLLVDLANGQKASVNHPEDMKKLAALVEKTEIPIM